MTLLEKQNQLVGQFQSLSHWEDRYKKIIEMGRALPDLPDNQRTDEAKIKGCQSQVWLHAKLNEKDEMIIEGDSDALIVKGLVAVLLQIYSGAKPAEIIQNKPDFLKAIGFEGNLSPSRANGLFAMLKQIQMFATAFQYMLSQRTK